MYIILNDLVNTSVVLKRNMSSFEDYPSTQTNKILKGLVLRNNMYTR